MIIEELEMHIAWTIKEIDKWVEFYEKCISYIDSTEEKKKNAKRQVERLLPVRDKLLDDYAIAKCDRLIELCNTPCWAYRG